MQIVQFISGFVIGSLIAHFALLPLIVSVLRRVQKHVEMRRYGASK